MVHCFTLASFPIKWDWGKFGPPVFLKTIFPFVVLPVKPEGDIRVAGACSPRTKGPGEKNVVTCHPLHEILNKPKWHITMAVLCIFQSTRLITESPNLMKHRKYVEKIGPAGNQGGSPHGRGGEVEQNIITVHGCRRKSGGPP